ncbi:hypothetical protein LB543_33400 [Mesorhizobium sp. ESP7-2]|uniref:hypothetical protein n=1 Tax=Mesorhizobium sp. ESP7-2 TaxID=2876622 RepID=UPI001CC92511|nr:hypothetical protein [Mesorhizobium sp. ESP7-2]MBZ9711579.1 hypothetical protein [Mesorhizobium sp. ESP7-2]
MAVAKKDQERITYAWMYGVQARKDGKERTVPEYWQEQADAWLQGFDGEPLESAGVRLPVSNNIEAELDEAAVKKSEPNAVSGLIAEWAHTASTWRMSSPSSGSRTS